MKNRRKLLLYFLPILLLMTALILLLTSRLRFLRFCDNLFQEEMKSNALTLHYTLSDENAYGIETGELTLGSFEKNLSEEKRWLNKKLLLLKTISEKVLPFDLQMEYDKLSYSLKTQLEGCNFPLLEEPLVPSTGIQSQLPILLAEYTFTDESDVQTYLQILSCIPDYFDSLISYETSKIHSGLFIDPETCNELITYCEEFLSNKETHFLTETFVSRLSVLNLGKAKTSDYLQKNQEALHTFVYPSYEKLCDFLKLHKQEGTITDGLFYIPDGTDYYAWLLRSEIGCEKSFEEIESILETALKKDASIIAKLTKEHPDLLKDRYAIHFDTSNPVALTTYLSKRAEHDFPKVRKVSVELSNVPSSMEEHLSPAFYLVPPIDDWEHNVIYLNQRSLEKGLSLFTTLAHESYPGHLYQTIYENSTNPHPVQRLLYFGGYIEGWGTYAEQMSYFYAPISKEMATLLSSIRSMTLNLYSHLDLYIHAYGWTEEDCTAYLKKYGITNAQSVHQMYLLTKQQPANYLKYYLGYLEICALKEQARNCLGSAFDLKEFHEFVLTYGPAPFSLLESYLQNWLREQQQGFSAMENP